MPPTGFHLAQLNIGRLAAPLDSAQLADFVAGLEPVNAAAESAPGFVWRLKDDEADNATSFTIYDDPILIVNMSVWADHHSLGPFPPVTVRLLPRHASGLITCAGTVQASMRSGSRIRTSPLPAPNGASSKGYSVLGCLVRR